MLICFALYYANFTTNAYAGKERARMNIHLLPLCVENWGPLVIQLFCIRKHECTFETFISWYKGQSTQVT